jgi:hypothetical protein
MFEKSVRFTLIVCVFNNDGLLILEDEINIPERPTPTIITYLAN